MVLETRHGLLVERLLDAGYVVLPVNPDLVARRRGPAPKNDDAQDARIACLLALDRHTSLRPLIPHGEQAAELRAIAHDDERAARDQRRLLNRLRHDLISTDPAALAIAGDDLGAPTMLRLLERWPTRDQLASASHHQLVAFARANRHGWPDRSVGPISSGTTSSQLSLPRTRQSPSCRRTGARPHCRTACGSTTFGIPAPACSSPRARASRRCRRSWGMRPPASPSTPTGHLFPSEMEALADRLEMVRDAALAKRARTQRGPTANRLGETAGG